MKGAGSSIDILFDGYVIGTWDGTNNSGSPVSNGEYKIQVDNIGASGVVTSVSQNAIVNRSLANITASVYNGAGELVRTLYYLIDDPVGSSMTNVKLSSNAFRPSLTAPASVIAGSPNYAAIYIQTSGTPVTLIWDGTDNSSSVVTPGEYTIQVHWNDGSGQTTDISRQILVMAGGLFSGVVQARPNVLSPATTLSTTFDCSNVANATGMKIKIYTITGELIQAINSSSTTQGWTATGLASGIYIVNVEVDNASGGVINQQRLKLLVIH
jgi:flagellar hook assembly protein FlgD